MRISKLMAVAASGAALVAAATLPAAAGPAQHTMRSTHTFPSTISPKTVSPGQTLTLRGTGAKRSTKYVCVLVVIKGANYGLGSSLKFVNSTSTGKVTCARKFEPYHAVVGGTTRHCPTTAADRRAGFRCAMAVSTLDKSSAAIGYFTAR
jgi:hypothetical protein